LPAATKADARDWFEENHQLFDQPDKKQKKGEQ
jgi:hypothetical protein